MGRFATPLLLVAYTALVCLCFRDYGITYDEEYNWKHGEAVLAWYGSGFTDRAFEQNFVMRYYGGLFDALAQLFVRVSGVSGYDGRHLFNGLWAVLTTWGVARVAGRLMGPAAGFWAALLLILTPRFFGHGFNNPKDIPFAAAHVWALDALLALLAGLPQVRWGRVLWLGICCGLTLGVRLGGFLLFGYLAAVLGVWLVRRRITLAQALAIQAIVVLVALPVMLPVWPTLHVAPIANLKAALKYMTIGAAGSFDVLFDGRQVSIDHIPRDYAAQWLVRILPESYALGLLLALLAAASIRRIRLSWLLVLGAALLPLILVTIRTPRLYDEVRHFQFATVLLAIPAGAGVAWLFTRSRAVAMAGCLAMIGLLGVTAWDMTRLHPYETCYFNRAVAGGLRGSADRWETDYWGNSLKAACAWLGEHGRIAGRPATVLSTGHPVQVREQLPAEGFRYLGSVDDSKAVIDAARAHPPDWFVTTTRWQALARYPGEVVFRVERDGVTLAGVVRVRQ